MKRVLIIIALTVIVFSVKAQVVKIESNKIIIVDKIAEIKGDTLFIYKDLDKSLKALNKDKNHKSFKYVIIVKDEENISGTIFLNKQGFRKEDTIITVN